MDLRGLHYFSVVAEELNFTRAARWLAGFQEEYPLLRFEIVNGSSNDTIDQIQRGCIELGIIAAPYDSKHLKGIPVGDELWCAIMPEGNPLAAEPNIIVGHSNYVNDNEFLCQLILKN